jgi:hypothetical protein
VVEQIKKLNADQIDEIVAWVKAQVAALGDNIKGLFGNFSFGRLFNIVMFIVGLVEQAVVKFGPMSGKDKKEIATRVINDLVDIPIVPEYVEGAMIGWVIDQVVDYLNKVFGKKWSVDIAKTQKTQSA